MTIASIMLISNNLIKTRSVSPYFLVVHHIIVRFGTIACLMRGHAPKSSPGRLSLVHNHVAMAVTDVQQAMTS